jgi:glycosyltransferase involved in cell wall biosynthesis
MDWLHNDLGFIGERKSETGFRVALMVHDLLPHVAPQFSGIDLDGYFLDVLDLADIVIVNSNATSRDLQAFAEVNTRSMPEVRKLPMGSALPDLTPVRPTSLALGADTEYILCVGTVTLRKNHHLLFDVWERMIARPVGGGETPRLVIAGAKGWLSDETMSRLTRTPSFSGTVIHIADATDENIAWLYEHCAFTVYPSFYEGWGLPVSESHNFGKVCLTTDRSSLPEAAEGLAELLDPYDRNLWQERILHNFRDHEQRANQEAAIRQTHVRVTALDSARTVLDLAGLSFDLDHV